MLHNYTTLIKLVKLIHINLIYKIQVYSFYRNLNSTFEIAYINKNIGS